MQEITLIKLFRRRHMCVLSAVSFFFFFFASHSRCPYFRREEKKVCVSVTAFYFSSSSVPDITQYDVKKYSKNDSAHLWLWRQRRRHCLTFFVSPHTEHVFVASALSC